MGRLRMRYPAIIEGGGDDYGVWFPDIDGIGAMGRTIDEAQIAAREVLRDYGIEADRDGRLLAVPSAREDVEVPPGSELTTIRLIHPMRVDTQFVNEMIGHSREEYPNECCGILSGKDGLVKRRYPITNVAKSPYRYVMDSQEHLAAVLDSDRNGWEVIAFYHSHTNSRAKPSRTDERMAQQSGYHDEYYVLVSLEKRDAPDVCVWSIDELGRSTYRSRESAAAESRSALRPRSGAVEEA